jgi:hypothetical protein
MSAHGLPRKSGLFSTLRCQYPDEHELLAERVGVAVHVGLKSRVLAVTDGPSPISHNRKLVVLTQSPALASGTKLRRQPAP